MDKKEKLLRIREVAELFQVHNQTIRNWIKYEGMPHIRMGTFIRLDYEEALAWIKARNK